VSERAEIGERHGVAMVHLLLHITHCDIGTIGSEGSSRPDLHTRREECSCLSVVAGVFVCEGIREEKGVTLDKKTLVFENIKSGFGIV
jgi:hypothetical protein